MPAPSAVMSGRILAREDLVEARLLDVEDLPAQRQDRLEAAIAARLAEPPAESPSTM